MASRISAKFGSLPAGEAALIPYVMAGYPSQEATVRAVRGLERGGADIIELGLPFSDPLADGPAIQNAGAHALRRGASVEKFWGMARRVRRETDLPLVLMTYSNIPHRAGWSAFASSAKAAGIDGIILPDMPVEEAGDYLGAARGIDTIFLASPNTSRDRMGRIMRASSGFVYMVAVYGTTGGVGGVKPHALAALRRAKAQAGGAIPVGVGFGVSTPQDVAKYARAGADAVIVGSAYIRLIEGAPLGRIEGAVAGFTKRLKAQTRRA